MNAEIHISFMANFQQYVIEMEIIECPPAMKGASATSRTKPATLPTGLIVQVPEYIEPGEVIKIDTKERKFLSRA